MDRKRVTYEGSVYKSYMQGFWKSDLSASEIIIKQNGYKFQIRALTFFQRKINSTSIKPFL